MASSPHREATFEPPIEREVWVDGRLQAGYVLEFRRDGHRFTFECIAEKGGRITAWKLDGVNVLRATSDPEDADGSTFWPSPQSDWGWPPPRAFDRLPCLVHIAHAAPGVSFFTREDPDLRLRIEKHFRLDLKLGAVVLRYDLINTGDRVRAFAPWEISRVEPGGLTFYPTGSDAPNSGGFAPLEVTRAGGVTWFAHDPASTPAQHKLFADGSGGWLAHQHRDCLFIKAFDDQPAQSSAPGEAEIEIYATPDYVEVEQQGAYLPLAPQQRRSWTVTWLLRPLPKKTRATPGSGALVELIDALVCATQLERRRGPQGM